MNNPRVDAIYVRKSGSGTEDDIQKQLYNIRQRFGDEGRPLHDTYVELDFTGTLMRRPKLDRCLRDARAGRFNRLLVDHPDRLSRGEPWHRPFIEREFADAGVEVCYASYKRPETDQERLLDQMYGSLIEYDRIRIVDRLSSGQAAKLDRGATWRGQPFYGWRYIKPGAGERDGHFVLVPEEAHVVRDMFDRILRGETSYAVAISLNQRGIRTTRGNLWTAKAVQRVIHNPTHAGRMPIGRYECVQPTKPRDPYNAQRRTSHRERPREEWRYVELAERIVSLEEWERALACLTSNQKLAKRNDRHEFLLSGWLRCGCEREGAPGELCKRALGGRVERRGRRVYRCTRTLTHDPTITTACRGHVDADKAEAAVWKWLLESLRAPEALLAQVSADLAINTERHTWLDAELAAAERRRTSCQDQLDMALRKNLRGELDDATYGRVQAELVEARDGAAAEVEGLRRELGAARELLHSREAIIAHCKQAAGELVALILADGPEAFAIKRRYLRLYVRELVVLPDDRLHIKAFLPELRPDQEEARAQPAVAIVGRSPWPSSHNSTVVDPAAGLPFSLILVA
jgi:DNA invertase Pin-like site-specific DNA recombinase